VIRVTPLVLALACSPACADDFFGGPVDPTDDQASGSPLNRFFRNLMRPDNHQRPQYDENQPLSCCGAGDVVKTVFKVEPGNGPHPEDTWYAWLDGKWTRIPPEKIVHGFAPDGKAYLFMLTIQTLGSYAYAEPRTSKKEIVCFVRPNGGN
jgi:hypothetical protein